MVTPNSSDAHCIRVSPTDSPPLISERNWRLNRERGLATSFIIIFNPVGKINALRMPYFSSNAKLRSGSKRPRNARIGIPKYQVGKRASNSPPVHAQSAGDQNILPSFGKKSCEQTKPG